MQTHRRTSKTQKRRAVVAVMVTVAMVVLLGFAALTIDVGAMYNARAELQRTADASALAAASMLTDFSQGDPAGAARIAAQDMATANRVLGRPMLLDPATDVVLGRSNYNADTNTFAFSPTEIFPDAIRVSVRMSEDSPNGRMSLFFAGILGKSSTALSASAIAIMLPRDIAIVADLSGSHNDDSELRNYRVTQINIHSVWDALPGGIDDVSGSLWNESEIPANWVEPGGDIPQAAGPAWGFMQDLGFGTVDIDENYDPTSDTGLINLAYNQNWNDTQLESALYAQGYVASEVNAIMSSDYDGNGAYQYRVAAALGLAFWNSGHPGGLWSQRGVAPADTGNANNWVGRTELEWTEAILGNTINESEDIWLDYIDSYMSRTWSRLYQANADFRYSFGAKTFMNYLLERRPTSSQTPELAGIPTQPMQAVKGAVRRMMDTIISIDTDDQVSLEVYGTTARHEMDLTSNFNAISDRLSSMQAAHYDGWTNMGGGIDRGIEELTSSRARTTSRKVIILLTDGNANVDANGAYPTNSGGRAYALSAASRAAAAGIDIFTISVGAGADTATMQQIADMGSGEHFYAVGSIDQYSAQLDAIFNQLGGRRPVQLIQ